MCFRWAWCSTKCRPAYIRSAVGLRSMPPPHPHETTDAPVDVTTRDSGHARSADPGDAVQDALGASFGRRSGPSTATDFERTATTVRNPEPFGRRGSRRGSSIAPDRLATLESQTGSARAAHGHEAAHGRGWAGTQPGTVSRRQFCRVHLGRERRREECHSGARNRFGSKDCASHSGSAQLASGQQPHRIHTPRRRRRFSLQHLQRRNK